jgi:hypothetical protein
MTRPMIKLAFATLAGLSVSACVIVEIPVEESNSNWVDERLTDENIKRTAPQSIPQTTLSSAATRDMDNQVAQMLQRRELLEAEQAAAEASNDVTTEEFLETGTSLTTPPD